jgi:hypothetical protein
MTNDKNDDSLICVFFYTERGDALSLSKCRSVNLKNALETLSELTTKRLNKQLNSSTIKQEKIKISFFVLLLFR